MGTNDRIAQAKGWLRNQRPDWEHDISAAMGLLEELRVDGWRPTLDAYRYADEHYLVSTYFAGEVQQSLRAATFADLPAAICDVWLAVYEGAGSDDRERR